VLARRRVGAADSNGPAQSSALDGQMSRSFTSVEPALRAIVARGAVAALRAR
jgi:hypothetical protein